MKIESYKDLLVWQKSMVLVVEIYKLTKSFPKSELYGLTSQMRRAALAIPSNVAEGYRRRHTKEYLRFLTIANGSAAELETQICAAKSLEDTGDLDYSKVDNLLLEILKMLNVLISKLGMKYYLTTPYSLHPTA
ncbi:MAG: four helix bundle protein [Candidatus Omnitrophota bacterium]